MPFPDVRSVPTHYELTGSQLRFSICSIVVAFVLLAACGARIAMGIDLWQWWVPLAALVGIATADFASGLIHWAADTWGEDDLPIVGQRLLVPFRVHHVNPDDFLRRRFIDTNGDVAFVAVPFLLALARVPLDVAWGSAAAVFGLGFCGIGMLTNQIHQWAHMPSPPRAVRLLQDTGLLLGRTEHALHHRRPYIASYCITTGWCNRPLEALALFRRLEAAITRVTGASPREDDLRYQIRHG